MAKGGLVLLLGLGEFRGGRTTVRALFHRLQQRLNEMVVGRGHRPLEALGSRRSGCPPR